MSKVKKYAIFLLYTLTILRSLLTLYSMKPHHVLLKLNTSTNNYIIQLMTHFTLTLFNCAA